MVDERSQNRDDRLRSADAERVVAACLLSRGVSRLAAAGLLVIPDGLASALADYEQATVRYDRAVNESETPVTRRHTCDAAGRGTCARCATATHVCRDDQPCTRCDREWNPNVTLAQLAAVESIAAGPTDREGQS